MAAGRDDDVLLVPHGISHGSCLTARGEPIRPELLAGVDVEGAKLEVYRGRGKGQPAGSYDRPSQIDRAGLLSGNKRAEGNIPDHQFAARAAPPREAAAPR